METNLAYWQEANLIFLKRPSKTIFLYNYNPIMRINSEQNAKIEWKQGCFVIKIAEKDLSKVKLALFWN